MIEKRDKFGPGMFEARLSGCSKASMRAFDQSDSGIVEHPADDRHGVVRRTVVHKEQFEVGISLFQYT